MSTHLTLTLTLTRTRTLTLPNRSPEHPNPNPHPSPSPKLTHLPLPLATEPKPEPQAEKSKSEALKQRGNEQMLKGDYVGAVNSYTDAIKVDPNNHVLYSNRANAYTRLESFKEP